VRQRLHFLEAIPEVLDAHRTGAIGLVDTVQIVRQADKHGTPQVVELEKRTAAKAAKAPKERMTPEAAIAQALDRLCDTYGAELLRTELRRYLGE
jgi:hypothetical protein